MRMSASRAPMINLARGQNGSVLGTSTAVSLRLSPGPSLEPSSPRAALPSNGSSNSKLLESQIHAIPSRCEYDLMYCRALWQIADEFDGLREIFRLEHAVHVFFRRLRRARLKDFGCDLAR